MPIVLYGGVILMFNVWEEIQIIPSWWYDPMPHALTPPPHQTHTCQCTSSGLISPFSLLSL